jgi:hypothetical protein
MTIFVDATGPTAIYARQKSLAAAATALKVVLATTVVALAGLAALAIAIGAGFPAFAFAGGALIGGVVLFVRPGEVAEGGGGNGEAGAGCEIDEHALDIGDFAFLALDGLEDFLRQDRDSDSVVVVLYKY